MSEPDDHQLLAEFVRAKSEPAFAALVARYVNLVYSTALRFTGNTHHAEEITQAVFIILARKAETISPRVVLSGWLYQVARLTSANFMKAEVRRQRREQEAYMQSVLNEPNDGWHEIAPLLDEAMGKLGKTDRDAVVLRYFENKSAAEIGAALRMNEEAARKRVNRALEKLHRYFHGRGISSTTAIIAGVISNHSVQAAPMALAKAVTAVAIAKGATASTSTLTLIKGALKIMAWTKAKTALVGVGIFLAVGTGAVILTNNFFQREPSYQGRLLTEWLADVDYGQPQDKRAKSGNAIRQMGARTVPFLLADLGDERFKGYSRKQDQRTSDARSRQATWAFDALGPIGKSSIPELETLLHKNPGYIPSALAGIGRDALPQLLSALTNEDFFVRDNTAAAIANAIFSEKITADEASAAFPVALNNLTYVNTNLLFQVNTRSRAAWLLAALRQSPEVTVPALIRGLNDTNANVAMDCAFALSEFGKQAKPAIPALTIAANSTNVLLNSGAKRALDQIVNAR